LTPVKLIANVLLVRCQVPGRRSDVHVGSCPADFVTIRGELHQGREAIARGHQSIFDSIYAGSRVEYAVVNARPARDGVTAAHLRGTLEVPTGPLAGDHTAIATIVLLDREEGPEVAAFHNTNTA
jgi:uncharacterized protein (TIGR02246 family)